MAGTLGNEGTTAAHVSAARDNAMQQRDLSACSFTHAGGSRSFMKRDAAPMKRRDETLATDARSGALGEASSRRLSSRPKRGICPRLRFIETFHVPPLA
jgi:hypothetical protein